MEAATIIIDMRALAGELRMEADAQRRDYGESLLTRAYRDGKVEGLNYAAERILRAIAEY